jgi:hypothetical protein
MTKNTNIWPAESPRYAEKATNVRFTALSIISMHMNIIMAFLRVITPAAPITKMIDDKAK